MPVLEAMACGVVPIYSEIPCLKEYAVGIPVKVDGLSTVSTVDGVFYKYMIDKKDVIEAVKYALGLNKDAYEDLSLKAREKAREMDSLTYKKWVEVLKDFS
jgi:glycosyltransferase involved in cell wall biosynthesis